MKRAFSGKNTSIVCSMVLFSAIFGAYQALAADDTVVEKKAVDRDEKKMTDIGELVVREKAVIEKWSLSTAPEALPTPAYVLDKPKIESLPYSRATDLLRSTPGITFSSASPGGDIGDDISIRGYSNFHGADTAVYVDGVPVNWSNSGMRHGMADFNWVTPELIERVEIIKGPFSAEYGNFNLAGSINIITKTSERSSIAAEAGSYGHYRATGVLGGEIKGITPFLVYDFYDKEGYRDNAEYSRFSAFNKVTIPVADGRIALRLSASKRENDSPGFLYVNDVRNDVIGRRSASPDSLTDYGENDNLAFVANYIPSNNNELKATAYVGNDRHLLVDTAFGPPQWAWEAERNYGGWRASRTWQWTDFALLTLGTDGEFNDGEAMSGGATARGDIDRTMLSRNEDVFSSASGLFAQTQMRFWQSLKLTGGLRYDYFYTDVTNHLYDNSGDATQDALSPKVGLAWSPLKQIELFTNYGKGFRSPASTELSPNRAGAAFNDDLEVAEINSVDVGATTRLWDITFTAALFTTVTERELRRDPDNPVNVINIGETERDGYELVGEWALTKNLNLNLSHTWVDTRIKNPTTPGADRVTSVPEDVQTASLSWRDTLAGTMPLNTDLFVQRIGHRPLAADGSIMSDSQVKYGVKVRLTRDPWSGFVELAYNPDQYSSDLMYNNGGVIYNPDPEFTVVTGIKYMF